MSHLPESLDEEIRELLENYKDKKATIYEPCTQKNYKECLIGLSEGCLGKLKDKLSTEKNESRACVASAQRVSDHSNDLYQKLIETRAKLLQTVKQKEANEKSLQNKIAKLTMENEKLTDRLRGKSNTFISHADSCDATLTQLKERNRKQRSIIAQLQANNQELLNEVLSMKEELILAGLNDIGLK
ncbi:unnamed protein product [Leptosia nina]|uniref:Uncharacterized protein n=1 Tax=Leptosia nina TaxID=320188 RepID=A0AAV1JIH9_9NEOP